MKCISYPAFLERYQNDNRIENEPSLATNKVFIDLRRKMEQKGKLQIILGKVMLHFKFMSFISFSVIK